MPVGRYPLMTGKESLHILRSAREAFDHGRGEWPSMALTRRIEKVEGFISKMMPSKDLISRILMWEIGKTYKDSQLEFDRTVDYAKGVIEAFRKVCTSTREPITGHGIVGRIERMPLGVVLCMGPFNYPLFETFTGLIPALISGNTVIFKTPRFGTLLYQPLLEIFRDSFPAGVVNEISGEGKEVIPPLLSSGMIDGLAFIGTSTVAAYLRGLHPRTQRLRCVLGLEAKNPAIILPDADLDLTVKECITGALSFNGQRCAALKLFFVPKHRAELFLAKFSAALAAVRSGMPWQENILVTPLVEPGKPAYLAGLMGDAISRGAEIMNSGGGSSSGTFFSPALLYPVSPSMRLYHEEQFGPLIPVVPYNDLEEVLRYGAQSNYGQQASLFGADPEVLSRLAGHLMHHVSRVNINCQCQRSPDVMPFTGRKDSGEGSLSIEDAPFAFTLPSIIAARDTLAHRKIIGDFGEGAEG
jgi:glyceraldehyde-3-phosphate dehydrogenase (NADP+)